MSQNKPTNKKGATKAVRVRKRLKETLTPEEHLQIVGEYLSGASPRELSEKYRSTTENINRIVATHWENLTNIREARLLEAHQTQIDTHKGAGYKALKKIHRANEGLNKPFLDLLSGDLDLVLTEAEIQFALLYVAGGSGRNALVKSGLDVGIVGGASTNSKEKGKNISTQLRVEYLKAKPNVAQYIQELRTEKYIPEAIDTQWVQKELLEQLDVVKNDESMNDYRRASLKLKITEDIGRTVGAFSDRLQVEALDPAAALDYLAELNQVEARVIEPVLEIPEETDGCSDDSR